MQTDLSIIIVSWNVWDLLRACLASIEKESRAIKGEKDRRAFGPKFLGNQAPTLEVIVVDNASADATAELLPARFPWVRFIRSATNLGFTAGNNVGYATSRGQAIYFLNPDTELVEGQPQTGATATKGDGDDSLWTLYRALMDNPRVGLVGPQLRGADNQEQFSRYRIPVATSVFFEAGTIGRYWPNNPWYRHQHMLDWPSNFRHEVACVVGAAMMARDALEQVRQPAVAGPFDESFFMYCEEVDLCSRLTAAGWRIMYAPEAIVIHYVGRSSEQVVAARDIYYYSSKIRYQEKYFGKRWASVLRRALLLNFRIQVLLEAGKWLVGHKRVLRRQRIIAYRQVMASGLRPTE